MLLSEKSVSGPNLLSPPKTSYILYTLHVRREYGAQEEGEEAAPTTYYGHTGEGVNVRRTLDPYTVTYVDGGTAQTRK